MSDLAAILVGLSFDQFARFFPPTAYATVAPPGTRSRSALATSSTSSPPTTPAGSGLPTVVSGVALGVDGLSLVEAADHILFVDAAREAPHGRA